MTALSKSSLQALRLDVDAALAEVAAKHGLVIKLGNGSFSPSHATFKLEVSTVREDGLVLTKEADRFRQAATVYGLEPSDLGREFVALGELFQLVGLTTGWKQPLLGRRVKDGKMYKFTKVAVRAGLDARARVVAQVAGGAK